MIIYRLKETIGKLENTWFKKNHLIYQVLKHNFTKQQHERSSKSLSHAKTRKASQGEEQKICKNVLTNLIVTSGTKQFIDFQSCFSKTMVPQMLIHINFLVTSPGEIATIPSDIPLCLEAMNLCSLN